MLLPPFRGEWVEDVVILHQGVVWAVIHSFSRPFLGTLPGRVGEVPGWIGHNWARQTWFLAFWSLKCLEKRRQGKPASCLTQNVMWPVFWTVVRTYAPYVTFPVAFVVGAVGYHLEWFIRGKDPQPVEEEKSISERREDRKLDELLGKDHTQVVSLKDKLEFAPKAVLNRNRPEKN
ncbi:small integral membrane protein 12 isoform X2 [Pongo pygmaeus]|uniref:Small integral membrane protein 12 n=1 Tax=Pongo abelii TaxID=9601 RepID=A0A8I5TIU3_PONAB|nr:small integral membrane protein 12 isoform X2 [Pongo pygmaeus]XP_054394014.1 small integral membrane protein 12 isoform X1 [Pongo abelii]